MCISTGQTARLEVWLDGVPISALAQQQSLGVTRIGRIQLGENARAASMTWPLTMSR